MRNETMYRAMLEAASIIESNPDSYNFSTRTIPGHYGHRQGCLIGHIVSRLVARGEVAPDENWYYKTKELSKFFRLSSLDQLHPGVMVIERKNLYEYRLPHKTFEARFYKDVNETDVGDWVNDPKEAAKGLRQVAENHYKPRYSTSTLPLAA